MANSNAKKQGREVSDRAKKLMKYSIFITNVTESTWKKEVIGTIYTLRWQIELIFKSWKSVCNIHVLSGTKPQRIRVLILSRLILLTLYTVIYSAIQYFCARGPKIEISMNKMFSWLKGEDEFAKILTSGLGENEFRRIIKRSAKDKRNKRKTTWEHIENQTSFYDLYNVETCKNGKFFEVKAC